MEEALLDVTLASLQLFLFLEFKEGLDNAFRNMVGCPVQSQDLDFSDPWGSLPPQDILIPTSPAFPVLTVAKSSPLTKPSAHFVSCWLLTPEDTSKNHFKVKICHQCDCVSSFCHHTNTRCEDREGEKG